MTTLDSYLQTVSRRPLVLSGETRSYTYTIKNGYIHQPTMGSRELGVAIEAAPTLYETSEPLWLLIQLKLAGSTDFLQELLDRDVSPYDLLMERIPNETVMETKQYRQELKARFYMAMNGTMDPERYGTLFFQVAKVAGISPDLVRKSRKRARRYLRRFLNQACQKLDRKLAGSGRVVGFQFGEPIVEGPANSPAFDRIVQDFFRTEIREALSRIAV